jgi:hypothetical protein
MGNNQGRMKMKALPSIKDWHQIAPAAFGVDCSKTTEDRIARLRASLPSLGGGARFFAGLGIVISLSSCGGDNSPSSYALNVYVKGLTGSGLRVALNGGAPMSISANSQTTIARLANGTAYTVAVTAPPVGPLQACIAANPTGAISGNNVDVMVSCTAASPGTVALEPATVTIDSAAPSSVIEKITSVVSPFDGQKLGIPIYVPFSAGGGESMVFAVDANNNVLLAALATTTSIKLSAQTTALALVRLSMGPLPTTASENQLDAAISAADGFPDLVSQISAALASNTPPSASTLVAASMVGVVNQIPAALAATLAPISKAVNVMQLSEDVAQSFLANGSAGAATADLEAATCIQNALEGIFPLAEVAALYPNPSASALGSYLSEPIFSPISLLKAVDGCPQIVVPTLPPGTNPLGPSIWQSAAVKFNVDIAELAEQELRVGAQTIGEVAAETFGIPLEIFVVMNSPPPPPPHSCAQVTCVLGTQLSYEVISTDTVSGDPQYCGTGGTGVYAYFSATFDGTNWLSSINGLPLPETYYVPNLPYGGIGGSLPGATGFETFSVGGVTGSLSETYQVVIPGSSPKAYVTCTMKTTLSSVFTNRIG